MAIERELTKRENPRAPRRDPKEPSNTMVDTRRSASANKWPLSSPQNSSSSWSKCSKVAEGNLPEKADVGAKSGSESRDFGLRSSDRRGSGAEKAVDACEAEKSPQPSDGEKQNWQKTKAKGS
ncbi:uncharacterized protein LOC115692661 isoform X2 [Syzygium oleosum]|uniref:uncharacterized protein LOC115692661 isoform X2 n=1 Tax=Syzygium oleosum TaxID=219896 RepID=UPI0024B95574|nr:uncharacterized protein LOC115692661 isoform X2 [Syzygium oleosum]